MTRRLDRDDIQGNVLLPYGRNTFAIGLLLLFHLERAGEDSGAGAEQARRWLRDLLPQITTGRLFRSKRTRSLSGSGIGRRELPLPPPVTVNVAFTWAGLAAFGVPASTLGGLPAEFREGMRARAALLHDRPELWDSAWREETPAGRIDLMVQLRVNAASALARVYRLRGLEMPRGGKAAHHPPQLFAQARALAWRRLEQRGLRLIATAAAHGLRVIPGHGPSGDPAAAERPWQVMESLTRRRGEEEEPGAPRAAAGDTDPGPESGGLRYGEHEHFGFFDGIADPVFEGQYATAEEVAEAVIGQGRLQGGVWRPLPTGEFLLGHPDQAQETPPLALPLSFSRNGSFLVVRKLHQHVADFERAIEAHLPAFQAWLGSGATAAATAGPQRGPLDTASAAEQARQLLRAKLVGRWEDGTPLVVAPTYAGWQAFRAEFAALRAAARHEELARGPGSAGPARQRLLAFKRRLRDVRYEPLDPDGARCPVTAHIRRSNPRDSGDPTLNPEAGEAERRQASSLLVNRRRILRRGMSYGERWQPSPAASSRHQACVDDGRERGTLFMALCSGLFRQFEFMQQQWLNYGGDFGAGNDVCPVSGVADPQDPAAASKLVIAAAADSDRPPFLLRPAAAVECRGGAYFFVPSLTALRLIAQGLVDQA